MASLGVNIPCVQSSFVVCRKNETQNEGSIRCIVVLISCSCGVILCK